MTRLLVFTILAWFCLTCAGAAQTPTFPELSGRVVDQAGLLSSSDSAALTRSLANLELTTTDQLVVVTLKSLHGTPIEDYGYQLGRHWHIGQKDRDSGVLLIVDASERKVRIEVGYGLEGTLTDAATKLIIENSILPRFRVGDFPAGIKAGAGDIIRTLSGEVETMQSQPAQDLASAPGRQDAQIPVWLLVAFSLAVVALFILCSVTHGGGLCQGIMQVLLLVALSGRRSSPRGSSSFSGGGGSFGGGGSSGSW